MHKTLDYRPSGLEVLIPSFQVCSGRFQVPRRTKASQGNQDRGFGNELTWNKESHQGISIMYLQERGRGR